MEASSKDSIFKLIECLKEEMTMYTILETLVFQERDYLISVTLDKLSENNRQKDEVIVRIRSLERVRLQTVAEISEIFKIPLEKMNQISNFIHLLPPERALALRQIKTEVEIKVQRVWEQNKKNEGLVQAALQTFQNTLGEIKQSISPHRTYQRKGTVNMDNHDAGHFVRKEV